MKRPARLAVGRVERPFAPSFDPPAVEASANPATHHPLPCQAGAIAGAASLCRLRNGCMDVASAPAPFRSEAFKTPSVARGGRRPGADARA